MAVEAPCPTPQETRQELREKSKKELRELGRTFGLDAKDAERYATQVHDEPNSLVAFLMPPDFAMRHHPVLRTVVKILMRQGDESKRINKHFGSLWDKVTGYDRRTGAIRGMTEAEQGEYMRAMLATEEKEPLTDAQLRDMKISKKAMAVYRLHRRLMPHALQVINIMRDAKELPPITGIKGLMFPHEFDGNFHLQVRGKPLYTPRGSSWETQADAWEALHDHLSQHPEDIGHAEIIADYQRNLSFAVLGDPERFGQLNELLAAVARGSSVPPAKAAQWFRDGLRKHGFGTHLLPRMGHEGYDIRNAIGVMSEYLNALPWWTTAERARGDIRALLGQIDPAKEPHSIFVINRYIGQVFGLPTAGEIQIDQVVNKMRTGKLGRVLTRAMTPLESLPLIRRPAQFINPQRWNPERPSRRFVMRARGLTSDLKIGMMSTGVTVTHLLHSPVNILTTYGPRYWSKGIREVMLHNDLPRHVYDWGLYHDVFKGNLLDDAPGGPFTRTIDRVATKVGANDTVRDFMMSVWRPLSLSERWMRESAFYSAYYALRDRGETGRRLLELATDGAMKQFPELNKYNERFLLETAKKLVDDVAFRYDRSSRAYWTTAGPGGLLAGQFKTYVMGTMALQKRMWDMGGTRNRVRALMPTAMMVALGGVGAALPLAHQLDDAFRFVTSGFDPEGGGGISFFDSFYEFLKDDIGGDAAEALYRGLPALQGLDLSRKVGYSHLHLESAKDLAGAFGGTLADIVQSIYFHDLEHAAQLAPGLGNLLLASQWAEEGALDSYHRNRLRFSPTRRDVIYRMFGLTPSLQSRTTDELRLASRKAKTYGKDRAFYIDAMTKAMKQQDWDAYEKFEAEALSNDIRITANDLTKEIATKGRGALERRYESMPKAAKPWFLQQFGADLEAEKQREAEADARRAGRALDEARGPQPPGTVAIPGEIGGGP
jgi:hypothetical protein